VSISRHAVIPPSQDRGLSASSSAAVQHGDNSFQGVEGEAESGIFQDYFVRRPKPVDCIGHFFSVGQGRVKVNFGQELDRLSVDFGVSRSAIVAALVESNSDELSKLASLMGGLKGGRRVSFYAPKRCVECGFQSCMCSTTATNSHN